MSINQSQDEIINKLSNLNGDIEKVLFYIVSLGQILPVMPQEYKTDKNIIRGCHSKIWLAARQECNQVYFYADSDTVISKGLVSLLLRIFNGQSPDEILSANLYFMRRNQLDRFVGTKRSNGFAAMMDHIKFLCSIQANLKPENPPHRQIPFEFFQPL
jgi:cysteine desulfuration protein SufE